MDRKEVEALLAETKDPMIAALCRTQLAVWDAPVAQVDEGVFLDEIAGTEERYGTVEVGVELIGQRVRIVPEVAA